MPISLEKIEPPKGLYEDTKSWVSKWNSEDKERKATYKEIYAKHRIERLVPKTIHEDIHWSFLSWDTSCPRSIADEAPPAFVAVIPGGRVYGTDGAVITPDNNLLADVSLDLEVVLRKDPKCHSVFSELELPAHDHLNHTVAVLSVLGGHNYYHWMVDLLPRIDLLRRGGFDVNSIDKFIVNCIHSSFQEETLSALGIPRAKIVESCKATHITANQLVVPSRTGHMSDMPKWSCDFLRREFLPESNGEVGKSARIYISRAHAPRRQVINESEVIELLAEYNFRSVTLEGMLVADQASLFQSAEVVVAPHGAGLTNLAFCKPGVKVVEIFSPNYVNCSYWVLSKWICADYYYLLGEGQLPPEHTDPFRLWEDIRVNVVSLSETLKFAGIS